MPGRRGDDFRALRVDDAASGPVVEMKDRGAYMTLDGFPLVLGPGFLFHRVAVPHAALSAEWRDDGFALHHPRDALKLDIALGGGADQRDGGVGDQPHAHEAAEQAQQAGQRKEGRHAEADPEMVGARGMYEPRIVHASGGCVLFRRRRDRGDPRWRFPLR